MTNIAMEKTVGQWWFNGGLMGFYGMQPLVMTKIAMEKP